MIVEKIKIIKNYNEKSLLEKTNHYLILDHKSNGISIYDFYLNWIKKIFIMRDLLIDHLYQQFSKNNVLLCCYEKNIFIWVDIKTENFRIISFNEFSEVIFSPVYWWEKDNEIIISDYNKNFYRILINEKTITPITNPSLEKQYPIFLKVVKEYKSFSSNTFFPNSNILCLIDAGKNKAFLYNYLTHEKKTINFPLPMTHDIAYYAGFIAIINEKQLDIISPDNQRVIIPAEGRWTFARAVFIPGDPLRLAVLSVNYGYLMLYEIKNG